MPWKWYESTVIQIKDIAPQVRQFWLRIDLLEDRFHFKAGQFITLDLPIHEKRNKRWRSYSIASHPDNTNVIELCVVLNPDGEGTRYLFEEVTHGSKIKFKGPSGTFTLPDEIEKELVFICTGTGVVPFRSMMWDIYYRQIEHQKIHLIFGTRFKEGILYKTEFEELSKRMSKFRYSVALSREKEYSGYNGYVHQIYQENHNPPHQNQLYYLCGWTAMIDDAVENLLIEMKVDRKQIIYELYG